MTVGAAVTIAAVLMWLHGPKAMMAVAGYEG
jgi:hypothetical protein